MKADHQEFLCLIQRLRLAQVQRDIMRNPDASRADRDLATVRFQQRSDHLVEHLEQMSEAGVLGRIALKLQRKVA